VKSAGEIFLPDRLRPSAPRRSPRRPSLLLAAIPALLALLAPAWCVNRVEVTADPTLPAAARRSLATLVGTPVVLLDLGWVRAQVESWPGVSSVEVALELPATLRVSSGGVSVEGSRPVGRRWHGVAADGGLAGPLPGPQRPVLEGFAPRPDELLKGLGVARRLELSSGGTVDSVRRLTPADCRVTLRVGGSDAPVVVHVLPRETEAERFWGRQTRAGVSPAATSDLRSDRRLVLALPPPGGGTTSVPESDGTPGGGEA